jgi:hypothetical protein
VVATTGTMSEVYLADTDSDATDSKVNDTKSSTPNQRKSRRDTTPNRGRRRAKQNTIEQTINRTPPTPAEDLNCVVKRQKSGADSREYGEPPTGDNTGGAQSVTALYQTDSDEYW